VKNKEFDDLLLNDQLLIQKSKGKVFDEIEEGKITFQPTFKYNVGNILI
jgi:hypothetical protein